MGVGCFKRLVTQALPLSCLLNDGGCFQRLVAQALLLTGLLNRVVMGSGGYERGRSVRIQAHDENIIPPHF